MQQLIRKKWCTHTSRKKTNIMVRRKKADLDKQLDPPVTIVIRREVIPGLEVTFEQLAHELSMSASRFEGHLGVTVFKPTADDPSYRIINKFDCLRNFNRWQQADVRKSYFKKIERCLQRPAEMQILTGLETWFNLPNYNGALLPPPRYKMTLLSWLASYPMVVLLLETMHPLLNHLSIPFRAMIISSIAALSMTYIIMPFLTHQFSRWLYPAIHGHLTITPPLNDMNRATPKLPEHVIPH